MDLSSADPPSWVLVVLVSWIHAVCGTKIFSFLCLNTFFILFKHAWVEFELFLSRDERTQIKPLIWQQKCSNAEIQQNHRFCFRLHTKNQIKKRIKVQFLLFLIFLSLVLCAQQYRLLWARAGSTSSEGSSLTAGLFRTTSVTRSWSWPTTGSGPASFPASCGSPTAACPKSCAGTRRRVPSDPEPSAAVNPEWVQSNPVFWVQTEGLDLWPVGRTDFLNLISI